MADNTRTESMVTRWIQALEDGDLWASSLQVGMKFDGARLEAERRYTDGGEQRMFLQSALDVLDRAIVCMDAAGILTRFEL